MADEEEQNPIDQLLDVLVYAPVGMLYEYQNVMPRLVKRGKSQVKLARVVGQLAMNRGKAGPAATAGQVGELVGLLAARGITNIGEAIGLAPPTDGDHTVDQATDVEAGPPPPTERDRIDGPIDVTEAVTDTEPPAIDGATPDTKPDEAEPDDTAPDEAVPDDLPLPIARYDELTAKVIVPLLDDLTADQLTRIRGHEETNRARKTVLGKLERLGA